MSWFKKEKEKEKERENFSDDINFYINDKKCDAYIRHQQCYTITYSIDILNSDIEYLKTSYIIINDEKIYGLLSGGETIGGNYYNYEYFLSFDVYRYFKDIRFIKYHFYKNEKEEIELKRNTELINSIIKKTGLTIDELSALRSISLCDLVNIKK